MPTLQDLASELSSTIPGLPNLWARKYVNRALSEIKRDRLWSWNIGEGVLITPQVVNGGTVATTQFSNSITFDTTAQAVLNPLQLANPPLLTRQFRLGSAGPIYNLLSYNQATGVATLDRVYTEATVAGSSYQVYKVYYGPPSTDGNTPNTDFLRYLSILNPIQGYTISGPRLYMTREDLNRRDPMRGAQGNPYYLAAYRPTPNGAFANASTQGIMQYELWPGPTYSQALLCQYERQHVEMQPNDYFPNQMSYPLVYYRALEFCYRWAVQNTGRVPELKGTDWRFLLDECKKRYAMELVQAKRNDNEIMLTVLKPGSSQNYDFQGPIDSNYAQSHGIYGY